MAFTLRTGITGAEALEVPGTAIAMVDADGPWGGAILFVHTPEQLEKLGAGGRRRGGDGGGGGGYESDSDGELRGAGGPTTRAPRPAGGYAAAAAAAAGDADDDDPRASRDALRRLRLMRAAGRAGVAPRHTLPVDPRARRAAALLHAVAPPARRTLADTTPVIRLPTGATFSPLPTIDPKARNVYYVTGPSGCGKSTWAANFGRTYYRWWGGKRPVYLISKLAADEVMDGKAGESRRAAAERPTRIDIRGLMATPMDWASLGACLVIFDDCDTFTGEEQRAMQKLQDEIATLGRHEAISMVVLSHLASNYKHTRLILLEAQGYVVFSATPHAAKAYLLKRSLGMTDRDTTALRAFGRWTLITKQVPLYILGEHEARVIV